MVDEDGVLRIPYYPRAYFQPFHDRTQRFACLVCCRRAGKTLACIHDLQRGALSCDRPSPRFAYVAPFRSQAKQVAWNFLRDAAAPLVPLGATANESELRIDYHNGGQVRLYGSDNVDALRGIYLDGVVLDEYGDIDPRLWPAVIRPALADRKGWAVIIGTPRGKNDFYKKFTEAQADSQNWFSLRLPYTEVLKHEPTDDNWLTLEEINSSRGTMSEEYFAEEWEADFEAARVGSYFGKLLNEAKAQGRIGKIAIDPVLPLRCYFDIGGSGAAADAMSIWVCQFVDQAINVLDYIEGRGQVLAYYVNVLRERGYGKATLVFPHDGVNENNVTGKRYVDHWRDAGFNCDEPVKNQGKGAAIQRIEAIRRLMSKCWFDETKTQAGRDALYYYHERMDEKRGIGLGPEHDWSSHAADAFGLMAICYKAPSALRSFTRNLEYPKVGYA